MGNVRDDPTSVFCELRGCDNVLPMGRRKFCSDKCSRTQQARIYRARKKNRETAADESFVREHGATPKRSNLEVKESARANMRKPPDALNFEEDWFPLIDNGTFTFKLVSERLEVSESAVKRWTDWCVFNRRLAAEQDAWVQPDEARRALGDFAFFRSRYFTVARGPYRGRPYATKPFHQRWIDAIMAALPEEAGGTGKGGVGGQQLILSPPRHGKTELIAHLMIWLICRNPDIAVIWITKAAARAEEVGAMIRGELERNEKLISEMLGPGGSFKPEYRVGSSWRDDEFSVGTRTMVQKAPTFRSFGRGGTLQSVDADLIATDDIEDFASTRTAHQRADTLGWLTTEVESRKEPQTAWVCIGSRNDPQDVLDHLLRSEDWVSIVETAHDMDCDLPFDDEDAHWDCMLWPEKFPYSELRKKFRLNAGREHQVYMRYLNVVTGAASAVFSEEMIRECVDRSRTFGDLDSIPAGYQILGSIDPSPGHYQVATLWAWSRENPIRYLLDIAKPKGGMDAWQDLARDWLTDYSLRDWVVEANSTQLDYINKREFVAWCQQNGVRVTPHRTGMNKHSLSHGINAMVPLFASKQIVLPYAGETTIGKVDSLIREFANYDPDRTQRDIKWRIDQVVSCWFAQLFIDTQQGGRSQAQVDDDTPAWMTPQGLGWVSQDVTGGWL